MVKILKSVVIIAVLITLLAAGGCAGGGNAGGGVPAPGKPAPDFQLQTLDGQSISLSSLRGHPVMINFWASWCGPCRAEMPFLQDIASDKDLAARGLVLLGVNLQESPAEIRKFLDTYGITFTTLLDTQGAVAEAYNVSAIPATYFIDKDGIIRYIKVGAFSKRLDIDGILNGTIMKGIK